MPVPNIRATAEVERHKTAIPRSSVSAPIFLLQSGAVISKDSSVLDYGCGRGDDVEALKKVQIDARGWDPHFSPNTQYLEVCDVVNLGFVLNVIEDRDERMEALRLAFGYARQCLSVSVMLIGKGDLSNSRPYKDGFLTSRNTFQKYYSQGEICDFIANTLEVQPVAAGPGVFFVFRDEVAEQRYLFRRQSGLRQPVSSPRKPNTFKGPKRSKDISKANQNIINELERLIRELGRHPDEVELPDKLRKKISRSLHALPYLSNLAFKEIEGPELHETALRKIESLTLFFALNAFSGQKTYRELPAELQRDVRVFMGSHQRAISDGQAFLYSIGDTDKLIEDAHSAEAAGAGCVKEGKFQFHVNNLPLLSARLQGYVAIGQRLAGDLSDATLMRIHFSSKKFSALYIPDFDTSALPRVVKRVKVSFQSFDVDLIDHTEDGKVRLLYFRSRYLVNDHPHFDLQNTFDKEIEALAELDFWGEGPDFRSFSAALLGSGIRVPIFQSP
ncbi:DNA phosphorothioation-associated putative methyltransferase [Falsihalocynthiibacter sp. CO-5D18]|uniref:DNA phosphorothioation-associated putative methyltransferase n=1 Tax=Falsihalocynthiibacter sp. CO-5D18 TaxID=3240872 RepID=UPI00350F0E03